MPNPDPATVERLKEASANAMREGRLEEALSLSLQLERLDPQASTWPWRTAVVLRRLGRTTEEIEALCRAARILERSDTFRCATVCNQILKIAPQHAETVQRLRRLHQRASAGRAAPSASAGAPTHSPQTQAWLQKHDSGLVGLPLREAIPGATARARGGVYQIPLADEVGPDAPLELGTADLPPHLARDSELTTDTLGNMTAKVAAELSIEDMAILAVEEEFKAAEQANKALSNTPLFSQLSEASFSALLREAGSVDLPKDRSLFKQGERSDALYVIARGQVAVVDEGPPRRGIAKLTTGDFFGEIALIGDQPRSATITALTDTQLISIDRPMMHKLIESDPAVLSVLLRFFRDRSVERLLATNPLFTVLSSRDRESLTKRFRFLEVSEGSVLLPQGEVPEGLVVLLAGRAEVIRNAEGGAVRLGELKAGDVCGEMSLIQEQGAIALVRAQTKCLAIELPARLFLRIVNSRPEAMQFIKKVIRKRAAQAKAILAGQANYAEGGLRLL